MSVKLKIALEAVKKWITPSKHREVTLSKRSLFLFTRDNRFRKLVHAVVTTWIFEYFILATILASCVVVKNSRTQNSFDIKSPYAVADMTINAIFAMEALLKIITYGFVTHRGSYLRNKWNVVDFLILIGGAIADLVSMTSNAENSVSFKVFRLFRVVRPLRLIVRYDNLKVVLDTIIKAFKTLLHVLLLMFLIVIIYAIIGIELFQGAFQTICVNASSGVSVIPPILCTLGDPNGCSMLVNSICRDGVTQNDLVSFDSIGYALLTVLQIVTMEDWIFIAYKLTDVVSPFIIYVYFISLVFLGGYFAVGLLMGVLGNEYLKVKLSQNRLKRLRALKKEVKEKPIDSCYSINRRRVDSAENSDEVSRSINSVFIRFSGIKNNLKGKCLSITDSTCFFCLIFVICLTDIIFSSIYVHLKVTQRFYFMCFKEAVFAVYTLEFILIILGQGIKAAAKRGTFLFDGFVWLVMSIEFIAYFSLNTYFVGLSSLRAITLIQVFKYTRFWKQLSFLIKSFVESIKGSIALMIVLIVVLAIYALLGNQLFKKNSARMENIGTFNSFGSSFLLAFTLLTGDGWKDFMNEAMKHSNKTITVIYFISFVVIGNFILINLFLGIIVDTLVTDFEENIIEEEDWDTNKLTKRNIERLSKIHKKCGATTGSASSVNSDLDYNQTGLPILTQNITHEKDHNTLQKKIYNETNMNGSEHCMDIEENTALHREVHFQCNANEFQIKSATDTSLLVLEKGLSNRRSSVKIAKERFRTLSILLDPDISHPIPHHRSLFLFTHRNRFRVYIFSCVASTKFSIVLWTAILSSCLLMIFYDPLNENVKMGTVMQIMDYVFTGVFVMEIVMKSIAYGLIFEHKNCYLRDPMNVIDATVVIVSCFNILMHYYGLDDLLRLRMMRAVRVVRILKMSAELKKVINCLFNSIQKICHFLLLYILINFVYAVIGVQMYKGMLGVCSDRNYDVMLDCEHNNETWKKNRLSFDNAYDGMVSLFVVSTMDAWFEFLKTIISHRSNSILMGNVFIISFILIMSFLLLNILTGFVIVGYHKGREKDDRFIVLDKSAQECITAAFYEKPVVRVYSRAQYFREKLWDVVSSSWFQVLSLCFIMLNTLVLVTQRYVQPDWLTEMQRYSNMLFNVIFTIEITIKMMAVPMRNFFRDPWLVFDAIVVFGNWIDIVLQELQIASLNMSLFRLFRVARLAKFVGKEGHLRQLFNTFVKSIKSVPSIAILLCLVIYLYAILGMELFGCMRLDNRTAINDNANFRTFGKAVLILIRVTTLDAWQDIFLACADPEARSCRGTTNSWLPYYSYFYFASFVFICAYWITNLFLAVIMDNFVYLTHDISTLNLRHIQSFVAKWNRFDIHGIGLISSENMVQLLKGLDPPLGNGMLCPNRSLYGKLIRLKITVEASNVVRFEDVLLALVIDSLNLLAPNHVIRHEIQMLIPKVSERLLDRIIPLQEEPKIFSDTEQVFYGNCASYVITGHFKIYASLLRIRNTPKSYTHPQNKDALNGNDSKLKET